MSTLALNQFPKDCKISAYFVGYSIRFSYYKQTLQLLNCAFVQSCEACFVILSRIRQSHKRDKLFFQFFLFMINASTVPIEN